VSIGSYARGYRVLSDRQLSAALLRETTESAGRKYPTRRAGLNILGQMADQPSVAIQTTRAEIAASELIDQLRDAVFAFDLDGRIAAFSRGAEELYGHRAEQVMGRHYTMLGPPAVREAAVEIAQRALAGEIQRVDGHILTRSGQVRGVLMTLSPLRDAAGEIHAAACVVRDAGGRQLRERQHELIAQLASETEAVIGTDRDGLITVFNRAAEELLGYSATEAVGLINGLVLFDPQELERRTAANAGASPFREAHSGERHEDVWTLVRKDGSRLEALLSARAVFTRLGEVDGFVAFVRDLSALRGVELARMHAEERFRIAFEHAPIGLAITSLEEATAGRWTQTNPALARMLGHEPGELDGAAINDVTHPDDRGQTPELIAALRRNEPIAVEKRFIRSDGSELWAWVTSTPVPGPHGSPPTYSVTQVLDVGERHRFEEKLRFFAEHDLLSGLYSRRRYERELDTVVAELDAADACGADAHAALLVLDLDGFKSVNDRFGHAVGDDLVTHIGGLLRECVRRSDFVARLGGDEFAVILRDCQPAAAVAAAEKLVQTVRERGWVVTAKGTARVTTSVGVALRRPGCRIDAEEWTLAADSAMYQAKNEGRNCYVVHREDGRPTPLGAERDSWYARLRRALDDERLVLYAQPIVSLGAATAAHYELLVRMIGEDGQLIPPGAFLGNAERFELIGEIDRWVMRSAIALLRAHAAAGNDLSLSVNLSGRTMSDLALAADLGEMLAATPIPAGRLVVEVTETAAIVSLERARGLAAQLRAMGCLFALDDFGSGFSSFHYLKHLRFDYLKIDGEFISGLVTSASDRLLVSALVTVARGLGTLTVAEFVGDEETVELLRELGVDYGQGFHLGRPAPVAEVLPALPES
jgi:diguanylate cyclase (GGDEF)-like protein/PAS domain S-box-containing protein